MNWRKAKPGDAPERVTAEMGNVDVAGSSVAADRAATTPRSQDFDETFTRICGPMVRSLAVACGDGEVAADAVQEAFTRAFVRWGRVSRLDDPPGWIRHVALNKI